ncbi:MAG: hypothetical protein ACJAWO_002296 [Halieaceae bacterium]|jgi:hypothetical protein
MSTIIDRGIENQEIKPTVDSKLYARRIFSMIEGGIFVATMLNDKSYMEDLTVTIDHLIDQELKN